MLRKKVFLYVSFVKSVQFVCAIIPLFKYELVRNRAYHVLTVHQSHSIGDYCARINSRAVFPIPNIEKLIVFIKKFIQYLVFFILIGLCAH